MDSTIFRAYDIRGIYQKNIDPCVFYEIGLSVGTYIKKHFKELTITVGNDIRKTSPLLSYAFISGAATTGINIVNTGTSSFGQTLFYGYNQKQDLICYVTASHLPVEWNGVKFYYGEGVGLPENEIIKIRDITIHKKWDISSWSNAGNIKISNPAPIYKHFFKSHFKFNKKIRIAVDCGGGSMTLSAPSVFSDFNLDIVPIYCDPDPLLSVRPSDPKPKNLSKLVETVKKDNCDFGVAFDGDGDRSVIVDDIGNILSAEQTGIILGKYGLNQKKGTIIVNIECSKVVEEQLRPLGFSIKKIQVGHTFLTLYAKKEKALLGIESSGHLILPSYFLFDDALIVPLKIAEILDKHSLKLSSIQKSIPIYPINKLEISCEDEIKFDVILELKRKLTKEFEKINTLDGIHISLKEGWALIRASNTSPIIRLTVEAEKEFQVKNISKIFKNEIERCILEKTQNGKENKASYLIK